jgi:CMP-N,N'-diacetyllegionaminic acid synthase
MKENEDIRAIDNFDCICVIPARGGSKGLLHKNISLLGGHPLISHSIKASKKSNLFKRIIVSTDSERISDIAISYGAECPFSRSEELATDGSLIEDTLEDTIKYIERNDRKYEYFCMIQCSSPLTISEDIIGACSLLIERKADMVVSVTEPPCNIDWVGEIGEDQSMNNFFDMCKTNRQMADQLYMLNGAIYIGKWDIFSQKKNYYGPNTYAYKMPVERSVDIDTSMDLKIANFMLNESRR